MESLNAKDHRINNYVQDRDGHLCKIYEIKENEVKAAAIVGAITKLPCTAIELTEYWLNRFGWEKRKEVRNVLSQWDEYRHPDLTLKICFWDGEATLHYDYIKISEPFKYVHRLQNLCYELKGEELTAESK